MGRLIDALLAFSRTSRCQMGVETVNMAALAKEVIAEVLAAAPARNLRFVVGELPPARCDDALIRQVLTNLLGNAVKYTGPRTEAVIELTGTIVQRLRKATKDVTVHYADGRVSLGRIPAARFVEVMRALAKAKVPTE